MQKWKNALRLLLVSPNAEDRDSLERLLDDDAEALGAALKCSVAQRPTLGITDIEFGAFAVVLCDSDEGDHVWRLVLEEISRVPSPPLLIVTSRLADERLWAEALNLGAWDVLAKPWNREEVRRTMQTAWLHWSERYAHVSGRPRKIPRKVTCMERFRSTEAGGHEDEDDLHFTISHMRVGGGCRTGRRAEAV